MPPVDTMQTKSQFDMKDTSDNNSGTNGAAEGQNAPEALDKIRSILFGEEARKTEERFRDIAELLEQQVTNLSHQINERVEQLDRKLDDSLAASGEDLGREREQRESGLAQLQSSLADLDSRIASRFSTADARLSEASESARHELNNLSTELKNEMNDRFSALKEFVDDAVSRLSSDKADREKMADWFAELSDRLRSD